MTNTSNETPAYIPAKDAIIRFSISKEGKVFGVRILDRNTEYGPLSFPAFSECVWTHENGCVDPNWLQDQYHTPEFTFSAMGLHCGFASRSEFHDALKEFAHIDICEWARKMLPNTHPHSSL